MTAPVTAQAFLRHQLRHLGHAGWDVHVVAGQALPVRFVEQEGVTGHVAAMQRRPSVGDVGSLVDLYRLCRRLRPSVTVMGTPKMGVVGTVAARVARVRRRVFLVHGYRADGLSGVWARVLHVLDRLACAAATDVVAVSPSLRARLVEVGVAPRGKIRVLGAGSANGVDIARFVPSEASRSRTRRSVGMPADAEVVAFVGRLTRDKGLQDLAALWPRVAVARPRAWLIVAGTFEPDGDEDATAMVELRQMPRVLLIGEVDQPELVFQAADVHLMLSRREGLGMVALEAAACEVPTVAYDVVGVRDAVPLGSGRLVPLHEVGRAADEVVLLLQEPEERWKLGRAARRHCVAHFDQEDVWERWATFLSDLDPSGASGADSTS